MEEEFFNPFKLIKKKKREVYDLSKLPREVKKTVKKTGEKMEEEVLEGPGMEVEHSKEHQINAAWRLEKFFLTLILRRRRLRSEMEKLRSKVNSVHVLMRKMPKIKQKIFLKKKILSELMSSAVLIYKNGMRSILMGDVSQKNSPIRYALKVEFCKILTLLNNAIYQSYNPSDPNFRSLLYTMVIGNLEDGSYVWMIIGYTRMVFETSKVVFFDTHKNLKDSCVDYLLSIMDTRGLVLGCRFLDKKTSEAGKNFNSFMHRVIIDLDIEKTLMRTFQQFLRNSESFSKTLHEKKYSSIFFTCFIRHYCERFLSKNYPEHSMPLTTERNIVLGLETAFGYPRSTYYYKNFLIAKQNDKDFMVFVDIVDSLPEQKINQGITTLSYDSRMNCIIGLIDLAIDLRTNENFEEIQLRNLFSFLVTNMSGVLTVKWFKMMMGNMTTDVSIRYISTIISKVFSKELVKYVYSNMIDYDYEDDTKAILSKFMIFFIAMATKTGNSVLYINAIISIASNLRYLKEIFGYINDGMEFDLHDLEYYSDVDVEIEFDFVYVAMFLEVYQKYLFTSIFNPHDKSIEQIVPMRNLPKLVVFLKNVLLSAYMQAYNIGFDDTGFSYLEHMIIRGSEILTSLYEHNEDNAFLDKKIFLARDDQSHFLQNILAMAEDLTIENIEKQLFIVQKLPFCFSFDIRYFVFRTLMNSYKLRHQYNKFACDIRRDHLVEDGIKAFRNLKGKQKVLRGRIQISYIDELGMFEAGIDTGGMFKEFVYDMAKRVLNPEYGLFIETQDRELDPNIESYLHVGPEHLDLFYFVGVIIGRAIYDEILIDNVFSKILLRRMLGKNNFFNQLRIYDLELYKQLLKVKNYDGDVRDFSLTFSVVDKRTKKEFDLIKNGSEIEVNNENKIRYIYYYSHFVLNIQNKKQTKSFLTGMSEVIPLSLLKMFAPDELQNIISGEVAEISIEDLSRNTTFTGGYSGDSEYIKTLWKTLREFTSEQKVQFLKFVTNCRRPPIMGFKHLQPPFTIQKIPGENGSDKLPVASVCFNTLKLPVYDNQEMLKQKLLLAIEQATGYYIV